MNIFWLCVVGVSAAVLGLLVSLGLHFGPWWGLAAGAVALVATVAVLFWWIFSNLRITG